MRAVQLSILWIPLYMDQERCVSTNNNGSDNPGEDSAAVRDFYDRIVAYEWQRLDYYVLEYAAVLHYLARYLPPPPARILDIGSGPGRYSLMLAKQGYEVTLIDLSPRSIRWAKEQFAQ